MRHREPLAGPHIVEPLKKIALGCVGVLLVAAVWMHLLGFEAVALHFLICGIILGLLLAVGQFVQINFFLWGILVFWPWLFRELVGYFGWQCAFQLNIQASTFLIFLYERLTVKLRILIAIVPLAGLWLVLPLKVGEVVLYPISEHTQLVLYMANTTFFLLTTISIFTYFAYSANLRQRTILAQGETQKQLIADLSHELKTPLATILTATQSTLKRERPSLEYIESLKLVERKADEARHTVQSMLDYSHLQNQPPAPKTESIEVPALLLDAIRDFQWLSKDAGVEIRLAGSLALRMKTDPSMLRSVLDNLLSNAIRHTPTGRFIHLSYGIDGLQTWIQIEDEGPGIPAEVLPNLFEPFYRGESSRTAQSAQHGLGLAIAHRLMHILNGNIEVISAAGRGATFRLIWKK